MYFYDLDIIHCIESHRTNHVIFSFDAAEIIALAKFAIHPSPCRIGADTLTTLAEATATAQQLVVFRRAALAIHILVPANSLQVTIAKLSREACKANPIDYLFARTASYDDGWCSIVLAWITLTEAAHVCSMCWTHLGSDFWIRRTVTAAQSLNFQCKRLVDSNWCYHDSLRSIQTLSCFNLRHTESSTNKFITVFSL